MEKQELKDKLDKLQIEQNELPKLGNDGHTHTSDGLQYLSYPVQYKCTICGQFYK